MVGIWTKSQVGKFITLPHPCSLSRFTLSLSRMLNRLCLLFCCCLIVGCGSPRPYDVRAVITLDGEPLAGAAVTFLPVRGNAKSAFGVTDMEGTVTFKTAVIDGEAIDGVLSGSYIMIVSKTVEEQRLTNNEIRALAEAGIRYRPGIVELIPEKYTRRETSDLRIKIGYWQPTDLTFNLQ